MRFSSRNQPPSRDAVIGPRIRLLDWKRMARVLTAEDVLPIVATLTPAERARLLHLIASRQESDSSLYAAMPPKQDEFESDEDQLSWDGEGWEQFR